MEYYDLVLGSIPGSFLGVTGGLSLFGIDPSIAIPLAALIGVGVILHALFVRAPVSSPPDTGDEVQPSARAQPNAQPAD